MGLSKTPSEKNIAGKEKGLCTKEWFAPGNSKRTTTRVFQVERRQTATRMLYKGFLPEGFANEFLGFILI